MLNLNKVGYDLDDISIFPERISTISSRSEVDPFIYLDDTKFLPLLVAPMDSVLNDKNYHNFIKNRIGVVLPRGIDMGSIGMESKFISKSLDINNIRSHSHVDNIKYYCIDIANGHMKKLLDIVKKIRDEDPTIRLIVGNIANPETYRDFAELGVWGIRVNIGVGQVCTTSANVSINYPIASLIDECYKIKKDNGFTTKIIADGGMRKYSDIIKALALGADLVMIGSLFNKCVESCSNTYLWKIFKVSGNLEKWLFNHKFSLYKKYRGMSTKEVQKSWGKSKLTTSEGITRWNKVEFELGKWLENFEDYLRSAMSYTDSKNLEEFKESNKIIISQNAFTRFNK